MPDKSEQPDRLTKLSTPDEQKGYSPKPVNQSPKTPPPSAPPGPAARPAKNDD